MFWSISCEHHALLMEKIEDQITRELPASLKSALPAMEEIEAELADSVADDATETAALQPTKRKAVKRSKKP
jgi:hypothetical protein